jgi:hypothetical protein
MQEEEKRISEKTEEVDKFKDQNERRKFYKAIDNLRKDFNQEVMAVEVKKAK